MASRHCQSQPAHLCLCTHLSAYFATVMLQFPAGTAIPTCHSRWRLKVFLITLVQYGPALGTCRSDVFTAGCLDPGIGVSCEQAL